MSEEGKELTCVNCGCADDTVLSYPMHGDAPALVSHEDARFCVVALRARLTESQKFERTIREGYNVGPNANIRAAIRKHNARHDDLDKQVRTLTARLAAAEEEGKRERPIVECASLLSALMAEEDVERVNMDTYQRLRDELIRLCWGDDPQTAINTARAAQGGV